MLRIFSHLALTGLNASPSQDCPEGHSLRVQSWKNDGKAGLCLKCYYVKRGSFNALRSMEFAELLAKNPALRDKSLGCKIGVVGVVGIVKKGPTRLKNVKRKHVTHVACGQKGQWWSTFE